MPKLWMEVDEALDAGLTHHGQMFGVDCWVTDPDEVASGIPTVVTKFAPAEIWISLCTAAYQCLALFQPDAAFPITIGRPINKVEPQ